jgi:hypothetical protein
MAKYKIIPSSRTIVQSPISIGHKAEKGVEAIEFDLTAWVETYGSGTLTVIMRRWGDAIPYPVALEIDENNKATWTLSDTDTEKAGMAYAQLSYIVGDEVVKKSDIYTFRVMDSLTGEGDPPEAYESWLEHLTHLAAEAMAEVLDIEGVATDKTLTVDGGIADAKAAGDELSALKADLSSKLTLTANGSDTIPDNADFNSYKTAGTYKVTNNTHAATMTNIPVKSAGKLIVLELSQTLRAIQIYVLSNTTYPMYTRYYQKTTSGESWSEWDSLAKSSVVSSINDRVTEIEGRVKSPKIKYESGSFENGLATERISVYIPAKTGYLMYRLYHYIDSSINCDCWQVYNLYFVNDSLGEQTDLTAKGEWECALHLAGRDDFSGGHTHGDELFTSMTVLLDGVPVDVSTLTTNTEFDKLTIIRTSKLYDPSDHTTEIAEHGVEYVFTKDGLTVRQSIKWLVSESLTNCFMAMFLPLKNKIDRAFFNSRSDIAELASATSERTDTVTASKATSTTMWDSDGGLSGTIAILHYPTGLTDGDKASISDNGGLSYNKLYYKVCGTGYASTVGELWKSESVYALNFNT